AMPPNSLRMRRSVNLRIASNSLANSLETIVPIDPTNHPIIAGIFLLRVGPYFFQLLQLLGGFGPVIPLQVSFDEIQIIFGKIGSQLQRSLQVLTRLGPTSNADDRRCILIEQSQIAIGTTVIEMLIQRPGSEGLPLHIFHHSQARETVFGIGELAYVHAEIIVRPRRTGVFRYRALSRSDAL